MASGGNKVLIATDPTNHNTGPSGSQRGDLLEKNGIAFAGAVSGATGAYVDASCAYSSTAGASAPPGTPVPIMDGLNTHGPQGVHRRRRSLPWQDLMRVSLDPRAPRGADREYPINGVSGIFIFSGLRRLPYGRRR
jgi:hypothetical protein